MALLPRERLAAVALRALQDRRRLVGAAVDRGERGTSPTTSLSNQAAGGYVEYDPGSGTFTLPPEQALALATEDSPASIQGAFQAGGAFFAATSRIAERFRTGDGLAWGEHHHDLFAGTERFFRPGYAAHLVDDWIPALDGVEEKLERGAKVADVGCGHGASTVLLAKAYPGCHLVGYDTHPASIDAARRNAERAGVADRVRFEVANAVSFPGTGFDLVAHFDSLHDMADPVGAARRVRKALAPGGTWMLVEPFAGDRLEENLNPIGRALLRRLDARVRSKLARGPRPRARRAGGRGAAARRRRAGGVQKLPPRHPDAVQPRARGSLTGAARTAAAALRCRRGGA